MDVPKGINFTDDDPAEVRLRLDEAVDSLENYVKEGNFVISVEVEFNRNSLNATADSGYFESVDRSPGSEGGGDCPTDPDQPSKGGKYSGGESHSHSLI